jgi:ribosomal protein S18 acetylase RimI-like enzyme
VEEACRAATSADLPDLVNLAGALRAELGALRGGEILLTREARPEPLDEAYRALLERDDVCTLIGTIDATPVGYGIAEIERLHTGESLGVISELYVDPEARGVSIGEVLAGRLIEFCTERGCIGIDAHALPGHRATKNFFEEQAFTARLLVMHHPLPRRP